MEKICDLNLETLDLVLSEPKDKSIVVEDVATFIEYCQKGNVESEPSKIIHSFSRCFCGQFNMQCINVYLAITNRSSPCIYIMRRVNNADEESIPYFNKIELSQQDFMSIVTNNKKVSFGVSEEDEPNFTIGSNMYVFDDEDGPFIMQPKTVEDNPGSDQGDED